MDAILDQKVLAPVGDALIDITTKPSLISLALNGLALSSHSLNPSCQPVFSLAGAVLDQPNIPGLPFSAHISCPRLDPAKVFVFIDGKEHHDVRVAPSSSAPEGSEIAFVYGLNRTSLVSVIAADVDGYPFTSSFPLHYEDPEMKVPSFEPVELWDSVLSLAKEDLHLGAAPSEPQSDATSSSSSPSSSSSAAAAAAAAALSACRKKDPTYPMLRAECQDPQRHQCDFYQSCVEASVPCAGSPSSYALDFGLKICVKFMHNLKWFSARGNAFVWDTMTCLQRALVPAVSNCAGPGSGYGEGEGEGGVGVEGGGEGESTAPPTCQSIHDAAFASHAQCYVDNGFCSLQCNDYLVELLTVGMDLVNKDTVKAMGQVAEACLQNVTQIIEKGSCMGDGLKGIVKTAFRVLLGESP